jgi:nitrite reductase (cytochrome c-552)
VIASGITAAQEARIKLARLLAGLGHNMEVPYPDIPTKAKAQAYIGLDMKKLNNEKKEFLETTLTEWMQKAENRESGYRTKTLMDY